MLRYATAQKLQCRGDDDDDGDDCSSMGDIRRTTNPSRTRLGGCIMASQAMGQYSDYGAMFYGAIL